MKNKGFTLVELLVAITILGVITGISIPLIRNIQSKNVDRKFTTYGTSVLQTAKLYNDAYYMDLFGEDPTGCAIVDYDTLETKQALKDIDMPDVSCNSKQTLVKIVKIGDKYNYQWKIGCGAEEGDKAKDVTIVYPKENKNIDFECTGDGSSIMDITANPDNEKGYNKKEVTTKLSILSNTGISEDLSISYSWQKHKNYNLVTDWKPLKFNVPPTKNQIQEILEGDLEPVTTSTKIKTPTGGSGSYYLLIRIDKLKDALGKPWADQTATEGKFKSFEPFEIDNEKPIINKVNVISKNKEYNSLDVKVEVDSKDTYTKNKDLKVCIYQKGEQCDYKSYDSTTTKTIKPLKLKGTYDGNNRDVYVRVKDKAGNESNIYTSSNYKVTKLYTLTYISTGTGKCNNETIKQYEGKPWGNLCVDKQLGYTFKEWNSKKDGTGEKILETTLAKENLKVYAIWTPKKYTCKAGYYLKKSQTSCVICLKNNYCTGGTYTFNTDKNQGITTCPKGYGNTASTGKSKSSECFMNVAENKYVKMAKDSSATACPKGYEKSAHKVYYGKTSSCTAKKYTCKAGYYLKKSETSCTICLKNYYCTGGTYTFNTTKDQGITTCPKGYGNTDTTGKSKSSECFMNVAKNNYVKIAKDSGATACSTGQEKEAHKVYYGKTSSCTAKKYTCQAGYYLKKSQTSCTICLKNYYCTGGTYTFNTTKDQGITPCPTGYGNTDTTGKSKSSECFMNVAKNKFVKKAKDSSATSCPAGYEKAAHKVYYEKTSSCTASKYTCQAGYYLKKSQTSCTICLKNYYCTGGTYTFNTTKDQGITPCPTGYGNTDTTGKSKSSECFMNVAKNKFVKKAKDSSATACSTGQEKAAHKVYYEKTSSCTASKYTCQAGYYLKKSQTSCTICLKNYYCTGGTYTFNTTKDQGITPCPTGYGNTDTTGKSKSSECFMNVAKNKFVKKAKDSSATSCSTGQEKEAHKVHYEKTSSCTASKYTCQAGYYLKKSQTSCTICSKNYYCTGGVYTYNPTKDQGITPCPTGYGYTDTTGRSKNSECFMDVAKNKYVKAAKDSSATACPAGRLSNAHKVYYGNKSICDILQKPTCTITLSTEPNSNGWHKSNVTIKLNINNIATSKGLDVHSQSTNGVTEVKITSNGTYTYYGYVSNASGSNTCAATIKLDKTAPTCGDPSGGSKTWSKAESRTVKVECKDSGSKCTKETFSTKYEDEAKTKKISITIKDKAGNTTSCKNEYNIYLDRTKPVFKGSYMNTTKKTTSGINEWGGTWKDALSGLSSVNTGNYSRVRYCYGTKNGCNRRCTTGTPGSTSGSHGGNTHLGTIGDCKNYWLRTAEVADNFITGSAKDKVILKTERNKGCQSGKYTVRAEYKICDRANNCDERAIKHEFKE